MKRLIITLLVAFTSFLSSAQNAEDAQGKKHGKWILRGKHKPGSGYSDETIVEQGSYSHGRKTGVWIKFHKDGKTAKLKGNYINNRPSGNYSRYYANGKLKESGFFSDEKQQGTLTRYYSNGQIAYLASFGTEGKENGTVKHYFENGKIQAEYTLSGGKLNGIYRQYNENGTVKFAYNTVNGKMVETIKNNTANSKEVTPSDSDETPPTVKNPITKGVTFFAEGYNKVYNENDEIWLDGNFKGGQLYDGKVYVYSANGLLKHIKIFKEGKFHSFSQN